MADERQRSDGQGATEQSGATPHHDRHRLQELERRLAGLRKADTGPTPGAEKFNQANLAWRMVIELVAGLVVGFGIGYGLDRLFGTMPLMLIVFVLAGLAAGIKTMLRTVAELGKRPAEPGNDGVGAADKSEGV